MGLGGRGRGFEGERHGSRRGEAGVSEGRVLEGEPGF